VTARTAAWFEDNDPRGVLRWLVAAAVVLTVHAAAIGGGYYFYGGWPPPILSDDSPTISFELTAAQVEQQEQPQVEAPTPPKETSPDAVMPEEKPPEQVEQSSPATRTTVEEQAAAPRVDPSWTGLLVKHLQQFKSYPVGARARNEQGVVLISINIGRDGHVLAHHIVRSSGFADLDAEAIAWVERAQPLPAFPASMSQAEIDDLEVPLRFVLR
jgi:periplasmic protein TonB